MAKKLRDEDLVLNIIVNGDDAQKETKLLKDAVRDLKNENKGLIKEQKALQVQGKMNTKQYRELTAQIEANNSAILKAENRMEELRKEMSLTEMTVSDLRKEKTRLMRLLNTSKPNTENWKKYRAELIAVNGRLDELSIKSKGSSISIAKMSDTMNRYSTMTMSILASLTGAYLTANSAKEKFLKRDDEYANVQKTTGLLREEVVELDKELQELDTRTAQNELLQLAVVAGKIGITAKEDVLEFVAAADKIRVALGEDLGDDAESAIRSIAKINDVFGISENFGIEESLLRVGSAINQVGASSTAQEAYIVNFLYRIGAASSSAGQSVSDAIGLSATLDSLGQRSEMSSTAVSKLMQKMFTETSTFSRFAKMDAEEYIELINTDFNTAFVKVLSTFETLNKADLGAALESVGITGTEATAVIQILSQNVQTLTEQQAIANQAFQEGTSILDEFNTKNSTQQAELDKRKKQFEELAVTLGEKLIPIFSSGISAGRMFMEVLLALIDFFAKYKAIILTTVAVIASYNVALKASIALVKLKTMWNGLMATSTNVATAAFQKLWLVMKANKFAIIFAGITGLITLLSSLRKETTTVADSIDEISKKSEEEALSQTSAIRILVDELNNENTTRQRKLSIQKELIELTKDSAYAFDAEALAAGKATEELEKHRKAVALEIEQKNLLAEIDKIERRMKNPQITLGDRVKGVWESLKKGSVSVTSIAGQTANVIAKTVEDEKLLLDGLKKKYEDTFTAIAEIRKTGGNAGKGGKPESGPTTIGGVLAEIEAKINELNNDKLALKVGDTAGLERIASQLAELESKRKSILGESDDDSSSSEPKELPKFLSPIEQEKQDYIDRLKEYNLYNRNKESLTKQEQQIIDYLTAEHNNNLQEIRTKATMDELSALEQSADDAIAILQSRHLQELADFRGTAEEKSELQSRQSEEMIKAQIESLKILSEQMSILDADTILSAEEQQLIQKRIQGVIDEMNKLKSEGFVPEEKNKETDLSDIELPLIGGTAAEWDAFFKTLEDGKLGIEDVAKSLDLFAGVYQGVVQLMNANDAAEFANFERIQEDKIRALESRLNSGLISQESYNAQVAALEEDIDKKRAELEVKQAKRAKQQAIIDSIINTAVGVSKAMGLMFPLNLVVAGLVGALGAAQTAIIASQPIVAGYERGGYTVQREDGKVFNTTYSGRKSGYVGNNGPEYIVGESGGEFIVNNKSLKNPAVASFIDTIDSAQRRGLERSIQLNGKVTPGYSSGGYTAPASSSASSSAELVGYLAKFEKLLSTIKTDSQKPIEIPYTMFDDAQVKFTNKRKSI